MNLELKINMELKTTVAGKNKLQKNRFLDFSIQKFIFEQA